MAKNITELNKSLITTLEDDFAAKNHTHSTYATTSTTGALSKLQTTAKGSLVDAINEVFQSGSNAKQGLVDALTSKGVTCSTSDSWDTLIGHVSSFSTGGGVSGAKIFAATSLPSTGAANQICIVTNPLPNKIHIGRIKPTSFSNNDIWVDLDGNNHNSPLLTFEMGELSTNVRVKSCYKLSTSTSTMTDVFAYYWNGSKWIVCSPTTINVTSPTGTSGTYSLGSTSAYGVSGTVTRQITFSGYEGVEYTGKCMLKMYHYFEAGTSNSSYTYTATAYNASGTQTFTKTISSTLGNETSQYIRDVPVVPGGYVRITASTSGDHSLYVYAYANKA